MIWFKSIFLCALVLVIIVPALSDPLPVSKKTESAEKLKSNTRHDHSGPNANGKFYQ